MHIKWTRKIQVKWMYFVQACKKSTGPKLGQSVTYNGERCALIQGVNNPYWNLLPMTKANLKKDVRTVHKRVHVSDFKQQSLFWRCRPAIKQHYKFLMSNWYSIDIRQTGKISYS